MANVEALIGCPHFNPASRMNREYVDTVLENSWKLFFFRPFLPFFLFCVLVFLACAPGLRNPP
jgi:hypothetical protein